MLKTTKQLKVSGQIAEALNLGFTVSGIAKLLGISRPTYYKKMTDNSWSNSEIEKLKDNRIIR